MKSGLRSLAMVVGRGIRQADHALHRVVNEQRARPAALNISTRSGTGTIYYLAPDYNAPSGGHRTIYKHVDLLNEAGRSAAVLHSRPGFRCTWFENETRVADATSTVIGRGDLLVVPEVSRLLPCLPEHFPHVVFNQSGHLTWQQGAEVVRQRYRNGSGLLAVMTVSEHSTELLRYAFPDIEVRRVRQGIDEQMFRNVPGARARQICFLPRRGQTDADIVLRMLEGRGALGDWGVEPLDGLPQAVLAERLRRSTIFLSFAYQEGFGLPPAEAMASGNYVIGFDGFGGREYFRPEFSRPVATGDVLAAARAVEETLEAERREPGWCRARGAQASRFVLENYSVAQERDELLRFYSDIFPR